MSLFAIGDLHGCPNELEVLLEAIAPGRDDTVVFLGDYVDRGPDSAGGIDELLALRGQIDTVDRELLALLGEQGLLVFCAVLAAPFLLPVTLPTMSVGNTISTRPPAIIAALVVTLPMTSFSGG